VRRQTGTFKNLYDSGENTLSDVLLWQLGRLRKSVPGPDAYNFPLAENDPAFLAANRATTTFTWIGHATILLQLAGKNILTDPQFSDRAAPVQWAGPKRVVPPGLTLDDLPPIDLVLITHDHFDSLDEGSIRRLVNRTHGAETRFIVPLETGSLLRKWGVSFRNIHELDWWDEIGIDSLDIAAIPLQHWGKRGMLYRNERLWAGWVVRTEDFRFCFVGDSGYSAELFQEIGKRLGPFDLAAVPIGAYEPRWFMAKSHVDPEEAVKIHQDIRSRRSIAIHWGTFILTDEPLDEPPARLKEALGKHSLSLDEFLVLRHGETFLL
jgi:N-acyl-phosphatidylethanolamine-hydrolysing phospholipase D